MIGAIRSDFGTSVYERNRIIDKLLDDAELKINLPDSNVKHSREVFSIVIAHFDPWNSNTAP